MTSAAQPAAWRVRYFRVGQICTLCCAVFALLMLPIPALSYLLMPPGAEALFVLVALQGPLAAAAGAFSPVVWRGARILAATYAVIGSSGLALFAHNMSQDHRRDQERAFADAPDWAAFEAALNPWPLPVGEAALPALARRCMRDRVPPLALFSAVAKRSHAHPTLWTLAAAACGVEYTRWALANGGSVVPKHGQAPSPLAFARDDETFALLRAAGATADQRDPEYPNDETPLFCAYDAAAVRRLHDAGASASATDPDGNTPLHDTAFQRWDAWYDRELSKTKARAIVQALLDAGVPADARNTYGMTPLFCHAENADVVRLLLQHGANPYAKTELGSIAVDRIDKALVVQLRQEGLIRNPGP